jgi:hypothetical protein
VLFQETLQILQSRFRACAGVVGALYFGRGAVQSDSPLCLFREPLRLLSIQGRTALRMRRVELSSRLVGGYPPQFSEGARRCLR